MSPVDLLIVLFGVLVLCAFSHVATEEYVRGQMLRRRFKTRPN